MKKKNNILIEYQYAVGLTLGLLMGAWAGANVISFIIFIWTIVIIERTFLR